MSEAGPDRESKAAEEPKVIVDEDWKSRVQAEKEAAEAARAADTSSPERTDQTPPAGDQGSAGPPPGEIPAASFEVLINSLAVQAMAGLGALPDPVEGHAVVRPDLAKHYIDTLSMLEAKTQGNRTAEESQLLTSALHQLRMLFVSVQKPPAKPPEPAGD